ncbi:hypothetical protein VCUG_00531 [Vavraia culicis subsp. floridensis]|uniref:UBC core domain-containing protein n=1 Tax=Vavraia culicis (isolate floridensis) TaxID=948595 RepID=L2GXF1_VAVCU|nr:uncharacterized protein VCUG_00531 [Vavraia culicis subsp. floridensis]ELA47948.2 hypothetical protein VCUG_00531 [Vavraia culicis subsp. floridensis]
MYHGDQTITILNGWLKRKCWATQPNTSSPPCHDFFRHGRSKRTLLTTNFCIFVPPMSTCIDRLVAEQANLKKERKYMFFARPSPADITKWNCGFPGPDAPLYKDSYYLVNLSFGRDYPFKPPRVKFVHKVVHPNVYESGEVCLSILEEGRWKPSLTVSNILCALQQLLMTPNASSPANGPATRMYRNKRIYESEVRKNIERWHCQLPW